MNRKKRELRMIELLEALVLLEATTDTDKKRRIIEEVLSGN